VSLIKHPDAAGARWRAARRLGVVAVVLVLAGVSAANAAAAPRRDHRHSIRHSLYAMQQFRSAPGLHPPVVRMTGRDPDPKASGDIFVDVHNALVAGPMILGPSGKLIWFDQIPDGGYAYNVQVQSYQGQPVMTFWDASRAHPGYDAILNDQYQQIATVRAGDGWLTEEHDFEITPEGTALITAQKNVPANLSSVGGPRRGIVHDAEIQEIDIATGQVLWHWDALKHVSLSASYDGTPGSAPYDYFHLNSVQQLPNGNVLVSARHTWTVYEISMKTGKVLWRLGGKHSSFKIGRGANFEWQHDARMQPGNVLTVFDNGDGVTANEPESRALRIHLNFKTMRATLVRAYTNNPPLLSDSQGSVQPLADGNTFVDWGYQPYFTEFSRSGRQLFSMHFPSPIQTYRAFRFQWSGQPTTSPSIALATTAGGTRVYASWNGATDVSSWQILAGPSSTTLDPVGQFADKQFETAMWVASTEPSFAVQALGPQGQVLATSTVVSR
jgi:Arylsulfotransferase (ASST)